MDAIVFSFTTQEDWQVGFTFVDSAGAAVDMTGRSYKIRFYEWGTGTTVGTLNTSDSTLLISGAGSNVISGRLDNTVTNLLPPNRTYGADLVWYSGSEDHRIIAAQVKHLIPGQAYVGAYTGSVQVAIDAATLVAGNPVVNQFAGPPGPAAWKTPVAWVTGTVYSPVAPADAVTSGGETYVCIIPHTASALFATDIASWVKISAIGLSPVFSVASTTTGAAGSSAAVVQAGTALAPTLAFTIPRGDTGATGGDAIGVNARIKARREILRASSPDIAAVLDLDFAKHSLMLCSDDASAPQSGGIMYDKVEDFVAAISGASFSRSSSGRRWNHRGIYETLSSNVARYGHAPSTGSPNGLIIMPQQTLLLLRSEEFDNASWLKNGVTNTANAALAPDGNTTADKIVETVTTVGRYTGQVFTGVASTPYTSFFIVAAAPRTRCGIIMRDTATSANQCRVGFNLATGTIDFAAAAIGTHAAASAGIEALPDGRFLIWLTGTIGTDTAVETRLYTLDNVATIGSPTYLGDGTSGIYVWDGNVVSGTLLPFTLPTTTAQVTVQPDLLRIPLGSWFNPAEGTFIVEATPSGINGIGNNLTFFAVDDGTTSNNLRIRIDSGGAIRVNDGVGGVANWSSASLGTAARNVKEKLALTYKNGGASYVSRNGAAAVAGPSSYVMPTVTHLSVGSFASSFFFGGAVGRLAYIPRTVTPAQVAALAT